MHKRKDTGKGSLFMANLVFICEEWDISILFLVTKNNKFTPASVPLFSKTVQITSKPLKLCSKIASKWKIFPWLSCLRLKDFIVPLNPNPQVSNTQQVSCHLPFKKWKENSKTSGTATTDREKNWPKAELCIPSNNPSNNRGIPSRFWWIHN